MKPRNAPEKISFTNAGMFELVMEKEDICRGVLERILHKEIGEITYLDTEHRLSFGLSSKAVAVDVYVKTEDAHYDIECQVVKNKNLAKRIRYYQALMDTKMFDAGTDYPFLKPTYIIFLCLFDPFDGGIPVSTFRMQREEKPMENDPFEMQWIMLNACAWQDEQDQEIRALLEYLQDGKASDDPFIKRIDSEVDSVNANEYKREHLMGLLTWEEHHKLDIVDARYTGLVEGRAEGEEIGIETGLNQGRAESESRYSKLTQILLTEGRSDDLLRASEDTTYLHELYKEYGL